jgi:hypothetical protein
MQSHSDTLIRLGIIRRLQSIHEANTLLSGCSGGFLIPYIKFRNCICSNVEIRSILDLNALGQ